MADAKLQAQEAEEQQQLVSEMARLPRNKSYFQLPANTKQQTNFKERTTNEIICCSCLLPLFIHLAIFVMHLLMVLAMTIIGRFLTNPTLTIVLWSIVGALFGFVIVLLASIGNAISENYNYKIDKMLIASCLIAVLSGFGVGILLGNGYAELNNNAIKYDISVQQTIEYYKQGFINFEYKDGQVLYSLYGSYYDEERDTNYYVVPLVPNDFDASKDIISVWYGTELTDSTKNMSIAFGEYTRGAALLMAPGATSANQTYNHAIRDALRKFKDIHTAADAIILTNVDPEELLKNSQIKLLFGWILFGLAVTMNIFCFLVALVRDSIISYYSYQGDDIPLFLTLI